jgi:hypothetical protein
MPELSPDDLLVRIKEWWREDFPDCDEAIASSAIKPSARGALPSTHGSDEQIFGADKQVSGRGAKRLTSIRLYAMQQGRKGRILLRSALPTCPGL